jgi:hypothetical protein
VCVANVQGAEPGLILRRPRSGRLECGRSPPACVGRTSLSVIRHSAVCRRITVFRLGSSSFGGQVDLIWHTHSLGYESLGELRA